MRVISTNNQKLTILLSATVASPLHITATYVVTTAVGNFLKGVSFTLGTTTETDLVPNRTDQEITRKLNRLTIYSPTGNANVDVTIKFRDSDSFGTDNLIVAKKSGLAADGFFRYDEINGWV